MLDEHLMLASKELSVHYDWVQAMHQFKWYKLTKKKNFTHNIALCAIQCTTPITDNCIWEDLEFPTRFYMKFLGRFWHRYVVDIL